MDKIQEMGELLDLKRKITYFGFDKLNLKNLEPLRYETQFRIDKLIAESKQEEKTKKCSACDIIECSTKNDPTECLKENKEP